MTLITQLRAILLAAGLLLLVVIYVLGRRKAEPQQVAELFDAAAIDEDDIDDVSAVEDMDEPLYTPQSEDEYDQPSYLRRRAAREQGETALINHDADAALELPPMYAEPDVHVTASRGQVIQTRTIQTIEAPREQLRAPILATPGPDQTAAMIVETPLSADNVAAINQSISNQSNRNSSSSSLQDNVEIGTRSQPIIQRKLIALRLVMSERIPGEQLLAMLQAEGLRHGKFNIFHRLHNDETVFSIASMLEPGSFDLTTMHTQTYPGVTLFTLLPGPIEGIKAFEQMMSCAQRLAQLTSGVVQDETGVMLLDSGIERLRSKVLDFEHLVKSSNAS